MENKIRISRETTAVLMALHQWLTYQGSLDDVPTEHINNEIVHQAEATARKLFPNDKIYIIPPVLTPIALHGDLSKLFILPRRTCIGQLLHPDPIKTITADYSSLVVVWWQSSFALPINSSILEVMTSINWDDLAMEHQF